MATLLPPDPKPFNPAEWGNPKYFQVPQNVFNLVWQLFSASSDQATSPAKLSIAQTQIICKAFFSFEGRYPDIAFLILHVLLDQQPLSIMGDVALAGILKFPGNPQIADRALRLLSKVLSNFKQFPVPETAVQALLRLPSENKRLSLRLFSQSPVFFDNTAVRDSVIERLRSSSESEEVYLAIHVMSKVPPYSSLDSQVIEMAKKFNSVEKVQIAALLFFGSRESHPWDFVSFLNGIFQNFFTNDLIAAMLTKRATEYLSFSGEPDLQTTQIFLKMAETFLVSENFAVVVGALSLMRSLDFKEFSIYLLGEICKKLKSQPGIILDFITEKDYAVFGGQEAVFKLIFDELFEYSPIPCCKLLSSKINVVAEIIQPLQFSQKIFTVLFRQSTSPAEAKVCLRLYEDWLDTPKPSKTEKFKIAKDILVNNTGAVAILMAVLEKFCEEDTKFLAKVLRVVHDVCRLPSLRERIWKTDSVTSALAKISDQDRAQLKAILIEGKYEKEVEKEQPPEAVNQPPAEDAGFFGNFFASPAKSAKLKKNKSKAELPPPTAAAPVPIAAAPVPAKAAEKQGDPTDAKKKKEKSAIDGYVKEAGNWFDAGFNSVVAGDNSQMEKMQKKREKAKLKAEVAEAAENEKKRIAEEKAKAAAEQKKILQAKAIAMAKAKAAAAQKKGWFN